MNSPGQWVPSMLLEKSEEIAPEGMKKLSQSGDNAQLWMCLVVKVKPDAKRTILYRNQRYIQRNQLPVQRFKYAVLQEKMEPEVWIYVFVPWK